MMEEDKPLLNRTGRALIGLGLMLFCIVTIIWLLNWGNADNSLHVSALSWSYTVLVVSAVALGLDLAFAKLLDFMSQK